MFLSDDIGKLILRLFVGIMILLHGINKLTGGIAGIKGLVVAAGLPEFFAYGVYIGEIIVPIFIILGLYVKTAALVLAFNMAVAVFLAYGSLFLSLGKFGTPVSELPLIYFVLSIVIFIVGAGKYTVKSR